MCSPNFTRLCTTLHESECVFPSEAWQRFFAEGCPKLGHKKPYLSFKTLNLITQLLSRPQNPIVLQNPKPQFVSMKLPPPPHTLFWKTQTLIFRSSPKTFIEIKVLGCRFQYWGAGLLRFGFPIRVWGKRPHKQLWDVWLSHPLGLWA